MLQPLIIFLLLPVPSIIIILDVAPVCVFVWFHPHMCLPLGQVLVSVARDVVAHMGQTIHIVWEYVGWTQICVTLCNVPVTICHHLGLRGGGSIIVLQLLLWGSVTIPPGIIGYGEAHDRMLSAPCVVCHVSIPHWLGGGYCGILMTKSNIISLVRGGCFGSQFLVPGGLYNLWWLGGLNWVMTGCGF